MFAALYAPALPAAALIDVARAFTPRFETLGRVSQVGQVGRVNSDQPRQPVVVLLDASGLSRLFGSAQELGEHLRDALQEAAPGDTSLGNPVPRIAIASTQTAATLLALGSPGLTVVMPGKEAIALAPLSVSVLDQFEKLSDSAPSAPQAPKAPQSLQAPGNVGKHPRMTHEASRPKSRAPENRMLEIFTKWGIRTLGALTALSGPEIHERFGERGAAVMYTSLRLTTRSVFTRTLQLPAPMRDPKTLRTLILLDLESHPPDAPIDIVRVYIEPTPARVLQWTLLERAQPAAEQVSTLIARLTALMGAKHVGSPALVDTWRAGAFTMSDFGSGISEPSSTGDRSIENQSTNLPSAIHPTSEISNLKSALRRFRFPIPTRVIVSEGRPVRVQTDRQGFVSGAITQAAGPWRTSGNWWSASAREESGELRRDHRAEAVFDREGGWDRDEWDVAMTDGTVYRLVVEREAGQWFLEGVID